MKKLSTKDKRIIKDYLGFTGVMTLAEQRTYHRMICRVQRYYHNGGKSVQQPKRHIDTPKPVIQAHGKKATIIKGSNILSDTTEPLGSSMMDYDYN